MAVAFSSVPGGGGVSALWYNELPACSGPFKPFAPLGCYSMDGSKVLGMRSEADQNNMTHNGCAAICKGNGFKYAGLAYVGACYCGAEVQHAAPASMDNCFYDCSGDKTEKCGGDNYMNLFQDTTFPNKSASTIHDYKYKGCWNDSDMKNGRALIYGQNLPGESMTTEKCLEACLENGYRFAGTEYYGECYCGVFMDEQSILVSESECDTPCHGNPKQMCGGRGRLSIYENDGYESTEPCGYSQPNLSYSSAPASTPTTSAPAPPASAPTAPAATSTELPPSSSLESPPKSSESSAAPPPPKSLAPPPPPESSAPPSTITSVPRPSTTTSPACISTVAPPRNDQWRLKDNTWQSDPLPAWKDVKSCVASASSCLAQVESCFKNGKWPDSMYCFDFKDWCFDVARCCQNSNRGSRDKDKCLAMNPPNNPEEEMTVTVPCSATQEPGPPASTSSTGPSPPAPTPSTLCRQPESREYKYGWRNPVGGIYQPIVQCNNIESEFDEGFALKLYDEKDSRQCKKYKKDQLPQACEEACELQYSHCVDTYARGCYTNGQRPGEDHGEGNRRVRRGAAPPPSYFGLARGGDTVGAFSNGKTAKGSGRWDCDGAEAEGACLHQYTACKDLNRVQQKPRYKCETFDN